MNKKIWNEALTTEVSMNVISRMNGMVSSKDLAGLDNSIKGIFKTFESEGFDEKDIVDYIEVKVDLFINKHG